MSRYNDPAHLPCEAHADREGTLAADLPSLGIHRYLCAECKAALAAKLSNATPYKGKREAWEIELATGADDTEYMRAATGRQHWDRGNF